MSLTKLLENFLGDLKRFLAAIVGFLIGSLLFFNSSSFIGFLVPSIFFSLVFSILVYSIQLFYEQRTLKSFLTVLASIFVVFGFSMSVIYTQFQGIGGATDHVKYNLLSGECEQFRTWGAEKPAWYYQKCKGEALERYCREQVNKGYWKNLSGCIKEPLQPTLRSNGFH